MELLGHTGEVCGLKWRNDGNDNVVKIWDGRLGDVGEGARGSAKWTKRNHTVGTQLVHLFPCLSTYNSTSSWLVVSCYIPMDYMSMRYEPILRRTGMYLQMASWALKP